MSTTAPSRIATGALASCVADDGTIARRKSVQKRRALVKMSATHDANSPKPAWVYPREPFA